MTQPTVEKRKGLAAVPVRLWIGLLLAILAVIFVLQNRQTTAVRLLFVTTLMPLWIALTMSTIVGILIGVLITARRK